MSKASSIVNLKDLNHLKELIKTEEKLVIDFFSVWCGDCTDIEKCYTDLSLEYKNITFTKCSIDNLSFKDFYKENNIVEIPSFQFYEKGKLVHVIRGSDESQIKKSSNVLSSQTILLFPKNSNATFTFNNSVILGNSVDFRIVEGNVYIPIKNCKTEYFKESDLKTTCYWKGVAHYYNIVINDTILKNAVWYYPSPNKGANHIKGHVAFYLSNYPKLLNSKIVGKPKEHYINEGFTEDYDYDLVVIGGGSGGIQASKRAANKGAKVAVLDFITPSPTNNTTWGLGGTCVNVGCIPKKLMHIAGSFQKLTQKMKDFGWNVETKEHDWNKMQSNIQSYLRKLNWKNEGYLRNNKVQYIHSYGKLLDKNTIELIDSKNQVSTITSKNIIISTGGRPKLLNIKGSKECCITSDDLFYLKKNPGKTLVIGGSYIALECAGFISELGNDVTLCVRSSILKNFDKECVEIIEKSLKKEINFKYKITPIQFVKLDNGTIKVEFNNESCEIYDTVIQAVGRIPNSLNIGLDKVGIKTDVKTGRIIISKEDKTNIDNIYAIGDVSNVGLDFTPIAIKTGKLLADRLYGNSKKLMNYTNYPVTMFTPTEYGTCGLTEEEANLKFKDITVYKKHLNILSQQLSDNYNVLAFVKIICDNLQDEKVIGFHFIGPDAGEVTQMFAIAINLGVTKENLNDTIGIHPTLIEALTSLEKGVEKDTGC